MAEIIQLNKPLEDEEGEFKKFLDEVYEETMEVAFVAKRKGKGQGYYIYCSAEDKLTQLKMLYRLKESLKTVVEMYPDPDDEEYEDEEEG